MARLSERRVEEFVRLQNWIIARLKQLKEFQTTHPTVDPEEWPEAVDLIFVTEFGRPVNVNSLVYKHFKPMLKRAGLPNIRLYELRHTAATLALTVGVSPKVVSEQLGHTSAAFTPDIYSHVLPHMQDDAAAKVEAALMCIQAPMMSLVNGVFASVLPLVGSTRKRPLRTLMPNQRVCATSHFSCLFPSAGCSFRRNPLYPPSFVATNGAAFASRLTLPQGPHRGCGPYVPCLRLSASPRLQSLATNSRIIQGQ